MGSRAELQPKSKFVHFYYKHLTSGGNDSNDLPDKVQLAKFMDSLNNKSI